jgi:hypothetical protein
MRKLTRLSARAVATFTKPGRHADGGGGYMVIDKNGAKRWVFMYEKDGRQRETGLGSVHSVPLAKARELFAECRAWLAAGKDPITERRAARQAQQARKTFGQCAVELHESKRSGWRSAKHGAQWLSTLIQHARPLLESTRRPSWPFCNPSGVASLIQHPDSGAGSKPSSMLPRRSSSAPAKTRVDGVATWR